MARVFISYRREGGSGFSGRIADDLERRFGASEVSRDVEDIRSGEDFAERIDRALEQSSVLLAVVDKVWLSACDSRGRRLDDPKDFVRLEIVTALKKGVRVIPVLVGGAAMPLARELPDNLKLLAVRQAHELSESRWEYDMDALAQAIEQAPAGAGIDKTKRKHLLWLSNVVAAGIVLAAFATWYWVSQPPKIEGTWELPDGGHWIFRQKGRDLQIDVVHYETREVWQRGHGVIHDSTIRFQLDLVFERGHRYEGQLSVGADLKQLSDTAYGSPLGDRSEIRLRRH